MQEHGGRGWLRHLADAVDRGRLYLHLQRSARVTTGRDVLLQVCMCTDHCERHDYTMTTCPADMA